MIVSTTSNNRRTRGLHVTRLGIVVIAPPVFLGLEPDRVRLSVGGGHRLPDCVRSVGVQVKRPLVASSARDRCGLNVGDEFEFLVGGGYGPWCDGCRIIGIAVADSDTAGRVLEFAIDNKVLRGWRCRGWLVGLRGRWCGCRWVVGLWSGFGNGT
jgi:hypothetical protein